VIILPDDKEHKHTRVLSNLSINKASQTSSSGMLSYCSSEAMAKDSKANSKAAEASVMFLSSLPGRQGAQTRVLSNWSKGNP
jgi:hypothetical protein